MIRAPSSTFIINSTFAPYLTLPLRPAPAAGSRPSRQMWLQDKAGWAAQEPRPQHTPIPDWALSPRLGTQAQPWKKVKALSRSSRELGGSADVQAARAGALHQLCSEQPVHGHVTLPTLASEGPFQAHLHTTARVQKVTFYKT